MSYRYLEHIAIADVAFEATGKTLEELFASAATALTQSMIRDTKTIESTIIKKVVIEAENPEMLLYRLLQEVVFLKDAEILLFNHYNFEIRRVPNGWALAGTLTGEELSRDKHELLADVKAVSLHNFSLKKTGEGWIAQVIVDV